MQWRPPGGSAPLVVRSPWRALRPRFELLRLAIKRRRSINDLASAAHREPSAVSRDVAKLQKLGLVRVDLVPNPGHGQMKMVTPVATRISIDADLQVA